MHRRTTKWRVDWGPDGSPEVGQLVRSLSPRGEATFARLLAVRVVKTRKPLPDWYVCRYALVVERLPEKPADEPVAWTFHAYGRSKPTVKDPALDRWSPLLGVAP